MSNDCKTSVLEVDGRRLLLNGKHFFFQGISFFNAIYNPTFNQTDEERKRRLAILNNTGINALRVWCQWDFGPPSNRWVDVEPSHSMYFENGEIREDSFKKLVKLIEEADKMNMVVEVVLFSHEKYHHYPVEIQEELAGIMAERLKPYRNIILQIWNEYSREVARYYEKIKAVDPDRLVSNSFLYDLFASDVENPAAPDILKHDGIDEEATKLMDIITPHTIRRGAKKFWEYAVDQIIYLMEKYDKPVIDDEPARTGTFEYGGIKGGTKPEQHIEQIKRVRACGAYHTYHHDMFQNGYGHPSTPPQAIPDPKFSSFHKPVFDYLRKNTTW